MYMPAGVGLQFWFTGKLGRAWVDAWVSTWCGAWRGEWMVGWWWILPGLVVAGVGISTLQTISLQDEFHD